MALKWDKDHATTCGPFSAKVFETDKKGVWDSAVNVGGAIFAKDEGQGGTVEEEKAKVELAFVNMIQGMIEDLKDE